MSETETTDIRPLYNDTFFRTAMEINKRINTDTKDKFIRGIDTGIVIFGTVAIIYIVMFLAYFILPFLRNWDPVESGKVFYVLQNLVGNDNNTLATKHTFQLIFFFIFIVVMTGMYGMKLSQGADYNFETGNNFFMAMNIIFAAYFFVKTCGKLHDLRVKYDTKNQIPPLEKIKSDKIVVFYIFVFVYFCILCAFLIIERTLRRFFYKKRVALINKIKEFDNELPNPVN